MNSFKEELQVKQPEQPELPANRLLETTGLKNYRDQIIKEASAQYRELYDKREYREYFKYLIATIMFYQNKRYPSYGVSMTSRFKASRSIDNKVRKRYIEADKAYDETGEILQDIKLRPFSDGFAINFVSESGPTLFKSTDDSISALIAEREKNREFLREMQIFKSKLIKDEFRDREDYEPEPNVPKIEYYQNCKRLIEKLLESIPSSETDLIASYEKKIIDIDNRLKLLQTSHLENSEEGMVDKKDISTNNKIDFFALLTDFEERYNNKIDIKIATMQFLSLFENNPVFEKLGVTIDYSSLEEKRAVSGYESNFVILNTPLRTSRVSNTNRKTT